MLNVTVYDVTVYGWYGWWWPMTSYWSSHGNAGYAVKNMARKWDGDRACYTIYNKSNNCNTFLPMTVRLTWALRVCARRKSTRQRYNASSLALTLVSISAAGWRSALNVARWPRISPPDHCSATPKSESLVSTLHSNKKTLILSNTFYKQRKTKFLFSI